jgi:pimeloyl-ACP methyl ester carboxylesterase
VLLFTRPGLALPEWLPKQHRLARTPGFLAATLGALRAQIGPGGQREVLHEEIRTLTMPTLVVWGRATGSSRRARRTTRLLGSRRGT